MADPNPSITIPISPGEVVDRLTILEIKTARMEDEVKRSNVRNELEQLSAIARTTIPDSLEMRSLHTELKAVNEKLWVIEDNIRDCERKGDFGDAFVTLARAVYRTNDERAGLKRKISEALGSTLIEEKSYTPY
jgi:hypothetical protein